MHHRGRDADRGDEFRRCAGPGRQLFGPKRSAFRIVVRNIERSGNR